MENLRIAAFGFRSIPPANGSAGADKFASELYPRLVTHGYKVTAYNRIYKDDKSKEAFFKGVRLINIKTVGKSGFDSLFHSLKVTLHIIFFNTAEVVHIHNGGNSIFALFLRLFGKKVFVSQDGIDWKRDKWNWYAKFYLYLSSFITAYVPNGVIFDNIFAKELFEKKYKKKFDFIPYGSEVIFDENKKDILQKLDLIDNEYFLFVGRFIPDKGIHYLIKAFEQITTDKKLVLVGGSPNPSGYEVGLHSTKDPRIIFPGYIYGNDVNILIEYAYSYIQPSDVEGLSPLILTVMGIGTPLICSDIKENRFIAEDNALYFHNSDPNDLKKQIEFALNNPKEIRQFSEIGRQKITQRFRWETVTNQHIELFKQK